AYAGSIPTEASIRTRSFHRLSCRLASHTSSGERMTSRRDDRPPPRTRYKHDDAPAGGWGSVRSLLRHGLRGDVPTAAAGAALLAQTKPDGFTCVSCSWATPREPHPFEFCENGAKATFWDLDRDRVDAGFFQDHTVSALLQWADHDLEAQGRSEERRVGNAIRP